MLQREGNTDTSETCLFEEVGKRAEHMVAHEPLLKHIFLSASQPKHKKVMTLFFFLLFFFMTHEST